MDEQLITYLCRCRGLGKAVAMRQVAALDPAQKSALLAKAEEARQKHAEIAAAVKQRRAERTAEQTEQTPPTPAPPAIAKADKPKRKEKPDKP